MPPSRRRATSGRPTNRCLRRRAPSRAAGAPSSATDPTLSRRRQRVGLCRAAARPGGATTPPWPAAAPVVGDSSLPRARPELSKWPRMHLVKRSCPASSRRRPRSAPYPHAAMRGASVILRGLPRGPRAPAVRGILHQTSWLSAPARCRVRLRGWYRRPPPTWTSPLRDWGTR